jgi:hypothetical protein
LLLVAAALALPNPFTPSCNLNGPRDVKVCYGAKGDGFTDDTSALKAAFGAAGDAPLYFPPGNYLISQTLNIDARYHLFGARYGSTIAAAIGFSGPMAIINTGMQSSSITGGIDDLIFNCNNAATYGIIYGGNGDNSKYLWGYGTYGLEVIGGCTTAGAAVSNNSWGLSFYNSSFFGNKGDGFQVLAQSNEGENISFYGTNFSNNGGNGLTIMNAELSAHDIYAYGCSFDYNAGWGVQNGTSPGDNIIFSAEGSHIESPARWILNFGEVTLNGTYLTNGLNSSDLGYLIDNEGILTWIGGRAEQSGTGSILKSGEAGITDVYSTRVTSPPGVITWPSGTPNTLIDPLKRTASFRDIWSSGTATLSTVTVNGVSGFTGTKTAGRCVFTITSGIITKVTGC